MVMRVVVVVAAVMTIHGSAVCPSPYARVSSVQEGVVQVLLLLVRRSRHGKSGGSYDVARSLVRKTFNTKEPLMHVHQHLWTSAATMLVIGMYSRCRILARFILAMVLSKDGFINHFTGGTLTTISRRKLQPQS